MRDTRPIRTYSDLATHCGSKISQKFGQRCRRVVTVIAYSYIVGACTIYLTTMKITLMEVFQMADYCPVNDYNQTSHDIACGSIPACSPYGMVKLGQSTWLFIALACTFPLVHIRSLSDAGIVSYIGVGTILFVNTIILVHCIQHMLTEGFVVLDPPVEFANVVNGITALVLHARYSMCDTPYLLSSFFRRLRMVATS